MISYTINVCVMYSGYTLYVFWRYIDYTHNIYRIYKECMSVRKQLQTTKSEKFSIVDVDALINKGAKVKDDVKDEKKKWPIINLRISEEMLSEVDKRVEGTVGITRTGWILQAIYEKLKHENYHDRF